MKKIIIIIYAIGLFYTCKKKIDCKELANSLQSTKIEGRYLDTAKAVIIKGLYNDIHSRDTTYKDFFTEIFQRKRDSGRVNTVIYFDNIHEGLCTWSYCSAHSNLRFILVRNSVGRYYYIRKPDWLCLELIETYYFKDSLGDIINSKDFILRRFDLTSLSSEVKVINQILKEEPRLKKATKSRYNTLQKIDLIHSFLYDVYQEEPRLHHIYGDELSNFKLIRNFKKNFLEMQFYRPDTANVKDLIKSNDYEKLAYYYWNKKAIFLRKKYIGIIVLIVNYCKEEDYFFIEKHFIPSCITRGSFIFRNM